jgi:hypothetical protein
MRPENPEDQLGRPRSRDREDAAFFRHDGGMGEAGNKPRKPKHRLDKVPKFEEPNELSLPGLTGATQFGVRDGRFGHGSDGKHAGKPGRAGTFLLKLLGRRPKE